MVDHAVQGYFGSWGRSWLQWSNQALSSTRPDAISPLEPISNRFLKDPQRSSRVPADFYMSASEYQQSYRRYRHHLEAGNAGRAADELGRLREGQRVYAILNQNFDAEHKRLHPMRRAADIGRVISAMRREMIRGDLENTSEDGQVYRIPPTLERRISGIMSRIQHREMANAMTMINARGYGPRALREVEASFEELRAFSPEVAEELTTRLRAARVYDRETVERGYGELVERMLTDGADASLGDLTAGARQWAEHPF